MVKRKAITVTTKKATSACQKLCNTPTQKNTSVQSNATAIASTKNFMLRSRSVRSEACATALPLPPNSLPARPTADFITPQLFTIPIMPAIAIAPIPMLRPYCVNITCGSTVSIPGTLPNNGSNTHHTKNEPAQITAAYFSPMIYPKPNTAALVLILKTNLNFVASISPHPIMRVLRLSVHNPKVDTTKSYNPPMPAAQIRGLA